MTSVVFKARFIDQNLGGHGSELRSDILLGYLTRVGTEYYQPIASTPFFIQPHVGYLREPVYLWQNQKRISERLLQRAGGGLDLGYAASKNFQISAMYQASTIRWVLKNGFDTSPTHTLLERHKASPGIWSSTTALLKLPLQAGPAWISRLASCCTLWIAGNHPS